MLERRPERGPRELVVLGGGGREDLAGVRPQRGVPGDAVCEHVGERGVRRAAVREPGVVVAQEKDVVVGVGVFDDGRGGGQPAHVGGVVGGQDELGGVVGRGIRRVGEWHEGIVHGRSGKIQVCGLDGWEK